jgi:Effector-associated domain 11/SIR2-like domain
MDSLKIDDILREIEQQRAVLLLGHNFLPQTHEALHRHLSQKLGDKLRHFYSHDGLFLFADNDTKTMAQIEAAEFYSNLHADEALLRKIVEMPFPLMVSANPDKLLVDAFATYRLRLQFDYFSSGNKAENYNLERPAADKPLLYNLCGSIEDQESLVLDYDDLFKMFKKLLGDHIIPNSEVRMPLARATTFIFVGFHFERWYTQLFLRYLNQHEDQFKSNSRNYVLKTTFSDADFQKFFMEQFNVKFIGADWAFFEELHTRFKQKYPNKMRSLIETLSPTATTIVQLIEKHDLDKAFKMLKMFSTDFDSDDQNLLINTEGGYNQYLKDKAEGIVLTEHLNSQIARVRKNILELAKKIV